MMMSKYHGLDEDEAEEGFQKNPTISEEFVVQHSPFQGTLGLFNSISQGNPKPKHRYSSNQKPALKLKPLQAKLDNMRNSHNFIAKRSIQDFQPTNKESLEKNYGGYPVRQRQKLLQQNNSFATLDSIMEAVVTKTKRTEIGENLPLNSSADSQEKMLAEDFSGGSVVYQEQMPANTYAYFNHLLRNTKDNNFIQSKYNLVLKTKMDRQKQLKEGNTSVVADKGEKGGKGGKKETIEFRGDFQSGNLHSVVKIGEEQYNVFLRIDTNTRGHRSWFYFKVMNHHNCPKRISLNICNVTRKFKMVENGQKVYVREDKPNSRWKALDQDIQLSVYKKSKYKISFELDLQARQELFVSLIPPYTYSQLLQDLQRYEKSQDLRVDILTHSITGLAIPLVTVSKGAAFQRRGKSSAKKKLILISGRIHPSQTCSSYIINGLIQELMNPQNQDFLNQTIVKIIPMLNPDGVVFGNFRTNYLGDDLNRSFHKTDQSIYPETVALKELGKSFHADYGSNFIGFMDMHGHSGQPNSFVYGPQYEESSDNFVECRILPKIWDRLSKYFKYDMSEFRLQEYKSSTARGYFMKRLKVPSYTIETSYALYCDKENQDQRHKEMSVAEWNQLGTQIVQGLVNYYLYLQFYKSNSIFRKPKDKKNNPKNQTTYQGKLDFKELKKQIQKETKTKNKKQRKQEKEQSQDSDGEDPDQDLQEKEKEQIIKKYRQTTTLISPNFFLPKVPKASLVLPSVIPSILRPEERMETNFPKRSGNFRQKKVSRPANLSHEYTNYLLKNISQIQTLKPDVINFGFLNRKRQPESLQNDYVFEM